MTARAPLGDRAIAVVPAGGSGIRMGRRQPKQYLTVGGAPILVHTLRALIGCAEVAGVVLAVPVDRVTATQRMVRRHGVKGVVDVVAGGAARQDSVWRGLQAVPAEARWVLVHDAVRPFISPDLVSRLLVVARRSGAATCGVPLRESLKRVSGELVECTVDRDGLWLVQTPQAFSRDILWRAHERASRDGFTGTDDAVLVERLGEMVAMVTGLARNLKITTPEDLAVARLWLTRRKPRRRT